MQRKCLSDIVVFANFMFYGGIILTFYLFTLDNNTPLWAIAYVFIITGLIAACVPEIMINTGYDGISKRLVCADLFAKAIMVVSIFQFLTKTNLMFFGITAALIATIDLLLAYTIKKQIRNVNLTFKAFTGEVMAINIEITKRTQKFTIYNVINLGCFFGFANNERDLILFFAAALSIIVHLLLSEKIIKEIVQYKSIKTYRLRCALWTIHIASMFAYLFNFSVVAYLFLGLYFMLVMDVAVDKKTTMDFIKTFNKI